MMTDLRTLLYTYGLGLWQRRWSIVLIAWAVCLAGWPVVSALPDRYSASALVYVDADTLLLPLMEGLTVRTDPTRRVEVVRQTLVSRPNLEELAQRTGLDAAAGTAMEKEALLRELESNLRVASRPGALFSIEYSSEDPAVAKSVVEALLTIFVERNLGDSQQDMADSQRFIEAQIASYERQLDEAERRLADFQTEHAEELAQQNNALGRLEAAQANLRQAQTELDSAIWRRDQLRSQLVTIPPVITERRTGGGADPALVAQLNSLLLRYTDQHPDVVATRRLIEQTRRGFSSTTVETPNPTYEQVAAEIASLDGQITSIQYRMPQMLSEISVQRGLAEQAPAVQLQLTQINRDYEILRDNYFALLGRREAAKLTERMDTDTESVQFRLIEPPVEPLTPSGPPRQILVASIFVVGLGAGVALAMLRLVVSMPIMTVAGLREAFALPVLGSVSPSGSSRQIGPPQMLGVVGGLGALAGLCAWLILGGARLDGLLAAVMRDAIASFI
jgi:polysaccharide chain length determinant protein (PEP-CTERM system associated)